MSYLSFRNLFGLSKSRSREHPELISSSGIEKLAQEGIHPRRQQERNRDDEEDCGEWRKVDANRDD